LVQADPDLLAAHGDVLGQGDGAFQLQRGPAEPLTRLGQLALRLLLPVRHRWLTAPVYRSFLDPDGRPPGMRLRRAY
jgi:hypothetical protein